MKHRESGNSSVLIILGIAIGLILVIVSIILNQPANVGNFPVATQQLIDISQQTEKYADSGQESTESDNTTYPDQDFSKLEKEVDDIFKGTITFSQMPDSEVKYYYSRFYVGTHDVNISVFKNEPGAILSWSDQAMIGSGSRNFNEEAKLYENINFGKQVAMVFDSVNFVNSEAVNYNVNVLQIGTRKYVIYDIKHPGGASFYKHYVTYDTLHKNLIYIIIDEGHLYRESEVLSRDTNGVLEIRYSDLAYKMFQGFEKIISKY